MEILSYICIAGFLVFGVAAFYVWVIWKPTPKKLSEIIHSSDDNEILDWLRVAPLEDVEGLIAASSPTLALHKHAINERDRRYALIWRKPQSTLEKAAAHAQLAVDAAWNLDCVELDYSPQSLAEVDRILDKFRSQGMPADQIGETVVSFGYYVGEVLVRHLGGVWKTPQHGVWRVGFDGRIMMVVEMPNGNVWNPIGKAFKLLENGKADRVSYFYEVAATKAG